MTIDEAISAFNNPEGSLYRNVQGLYETLYNSYMGSGVGQNADEWAHMAMSKMQQEGIIAPGQNLASSIWESGQPTSMTFGEAERTDEESWFWDRVNAYNRGEIPFDSAFFSEEDKERARKLVQGQSTGKDVAAAAAAGLSLDAYYSQLKQAGNYGTTDKGQFESSRQAGTSFKEAGPATAGQDWRGQGATTRYTPPSGSFEWRPALPASAMAPQGVSLSRPQWGAANQAMMNVGVPNYPDDAGGFRTPANYPWPEPGEPLSPSTEWENQQAFNIPENLMMMGGGGGEFADVGTGTGTGTGTGIGTGTGTGDLNMTYQEKLDLFNMYKEQGMSDAVAAIRANFTPADYYELQSTTGTGRRQLFQGAMSFLPTMTSMGQNLLGRQFDPLSARYMLEQTLGRVPAAGTFMDFLGDVGQRAGDATRPLMGMLQNIYATRNQPTTFEGTTQTPWQLLLEQSVDPADAFELAYESALPNIPLSLRGGFRSGAQRALQQHIATSPTAPFLDAFAGRGFQF